MKCELSEQIIQSSDALLCLLSHVLRTFLHCLALNQSSTVLKCMFASQRLLVSKVIDRRAVFHQYITLFKSFNNLCKDCNN